MSLKQENIRVWITGTSRDNWLSALSKRRKGEGAMNTDIALHYLQNREELGTIADYLSGRSLISHGINAVSSDDLSKHIPHFSHIKNGGEKLLKPEEWKNVRRIIIEKRPDLEQVIDNLEERQRYQPVLRDNAAIIYDMIYSILEIFNPSGINSLKNLMDEWREDIEAQDEIPQTNELLNGAVDKLSESDHTVGVETLFGDTAGEVPEIFQDLNQGLPDYENIQLNGRFSSHQMRLKDPSTGRTVTIILAHKQANQSDLLGSDLIYQNDLNQSLVFIQYKRFKNNLWYVQPRDGQLLTLLETCKAQDSCANYDKKKDDYLNSQAMRLYDCPVFYKLLDAEIDGDKRSSGGHYIQACRGFKLLEEVTPRKSIKRELVRENGFGVTTFSKLLRRAQIGSRASSFENLKDRIQAHLKGTLSKNQLIGFAYETTS